MSNRSVHKVHEDCELIFDDAQGAKDEGYARGLLEKVLHTHNKSKNKGLKITSLDSFFLKDKTKNNALQKVTNQDTAKKVQQNLEKWASPASSPSNAFLSYAPKKDKILRSAQAPYLPLYAHSKNSSDAPMNPIHNETFNTNMKLAERQMRQNRK